MYNRPLQFEMRHPLSSIRPNASSQSGGGSLAEAIRKAALASNRLPKDNEIMESTNLKSYLPLGRFREIEGMFDAIKAIHQAESPGAFEASSEEEFVDQWFAHDSQLDRGIRTALNTLDPSLSDTSRRQWLHVSGILLNRMYLKAGAVKDLNTAIDYARSAMSNPMADIRQLAWKEQKNRRSLAHINCPNLETALASLRINSQSTGIPELFSDENSPFFEHFNFPKEGAMNKWMFKTNLASYLGDRYLRLGEGDENIDQDIDEAIYFARQAILDTPSHSKDLPGRMNNLATLLGDRYSGLGSRADLCEAVKWARLSVQETSSDDDRELPGRLNNLAALLVDEGCGDRSQLLSQTDEALRFERFGYNKELKQAQQYFYDAMTQKYAFVHTRVLAGSLFLALPGVLQDVDRAEKAVETCAKLLPASIPYSLGTEDKQYLLSKTLSLQGGKACF